MDLKHLNTFLTLCEIKNFTRTAEYLHYAQSNVTTQIQQLEKELNTHLFERIGKKVILTSEAKELIPYAKKMLNLSNDIKFKFTYERNNRITIGASESICIYRLPAIIKAFQIARPDVELYVRVLDTPDFIPLLADNTIDIAFVLDTPINDTSINIELNIEETIGIFSLPEHILANKAKVSINDIAKQRLILTGKDCCYRKKFEKDLLKIENRAPLALETSSLQVIKQSVLSGLGMCVLPQIVIQKELNNKEIIRIHYETDYNIISQLIIHKDKWRTQILNEFIDVIKEVV